MFGRYIPRHLAPLAPISKGRVGRRSLVLGVALLMVSAGLVLAAELVTAELDGTANHVTVEQGQTTNFTISVSATGAIKCVATSSNPATAQVHTVYSLSETGVLSSTTFSSALNFFAGATLPSGQNCSVTWSGAPTPYQVAASVTAHASTPPGSYTITLSPGAGTVMLANPDGAGGNLEDEFSTSITVEVVASSATDTTPPTITITTPVDGAIYVLNQVVFADYECEDEEGGSGLASCVGTVPDGDPIDTSSVGTKSFTVDAADNAANQASLTHTYYVWYDFDGFYRPVDNAPTWNVAKAGSAIPVKFSLNGDQGLDIFAPGRPRVVQITCPSNGAGEEIEETVTAGGSSLNYDATLDQYNYVWKTKKEWAGRCFRFELGLKDGSNRHFLVQFK